jgi:antitoxin (DNA-binding transcriptional repressor) of toxin-antitoxin stability system
MKVVEMAEATASLAEYARAADREPVVLAAGGIPVAVLVPVEGVDLESLVLSTHPDFLELIERSRLRQQAEGGIGSADVRRRLGLNPPAQTRQRRYADCPVARNSPGLWLDRSARRGDERIGLDEQVGGNTQLGVQSPDHGE